MSNKTVYFLIDCSGSMYGNRADAVNMAMRKIVEEAVPEIKVQKSADLELSFVVLGFSDSFQGKVVQLLPRTKLDNFDTWTPIEADNFDGGTPTGAAIQAVIDDIRGGNHGDQDLNAVAPAIILISDGLPNGKNPSYEEMLECAVKGNPKEVVEFRRALRVALAMDVDDVGRESLKKFGKLSNKMESAGLSSYYDCSGEYINQFVEILKSVTVNVSVG